MSEYSIKPLSVWEDKDCYKVGPVCDPQEKGRALVVVPKSVGKNALTYAKLAKQIISKWQMEYEGKGL